MEELIVRESRSEDLSRTLSIVCASKLRFNGRYMDVLRSPQKLEIIGDPIVVRSNALLILKGGLL